MIGSAIIDPPILASVVICTRNRAHSLARTLDSLFHAAAHTCEPWELIVVDNGSSDDTPATVKSFATRMPLRLVSQPVAGLSNARNAGVAVVRGTYVLWTDDDVMVDEQWLAAWFRAFRNRPDDAVFGGRTEPRFEEPQQAWFIEGQRHLQSLLAVRDADWSEVTEHQLPWGLNYAVRTTEQRRHPYDPELGVAPGRRRGGEEIAVIAAILAAGGTGSWVWDATVYHMIPADRQTADYVVTFHSAMGFDYPMEGLFNDRQGRLRALLAACHTMTKSLIAVWSARFRGETDVASLVSYAKAKGSVARYLWGQGSWLRASGD